MPANNTRRLCTRCKAGMIIEEWGEFSLSIPEGVKKWHKDRHTDTKKEVGAQRSQLGPSEARLMQRASFLPGWSECKAETTTLRLVMEEPASVRQELDARLRAHEAMTRRDNGAPGGHNRRPLKERDIEASFEETRGTSEERPRTNDDSDEIDLIRPCREEY